MKILGAGLAGCLAGSVFSEATILEAKPEFKEPNHQALLRFRSDSISRFTGIPFRKVLVKKGIWYKGAYHSPNPRLCNFYSIKVAGVIQDRSISNLTEEHRWIAPVNIHQILVESLGPRIQWGQQITERPDDDTVLSTLPLPVLLKILGVETQLGSLAFVHETICVHKYRIQNCDVFQTIYFPDPDIPVYRASITGDELIVESIGLSEDRERSVIADVLIAFGLSDWPQLIGVYTQRLGKIVPLPDLARKSLLFSLTINYNIWSLGRYACWRNILLDDVFEDIFRIREQLSKSHYDLAKESFICK